MGGLIVENLFANCEIAHNGLWTQIGSSAMTGKPRELANLKGVSHFEPKL